MSDRRLYAVDLMADLPRLDKHCNFNVAAKRGKHRHCGNWATTTIEGWALCDKHAKATSKQLEVG